MIQRIFIIGLILSFPPVIFACYASGVCGARPYCPPSGFGCGQFGCQRNNQPLTALDEQQALAALSPTAADLSIKGRRQFQNPNQVFLECCIDRQLPDACLNKCNFNRYNQQTLMLMYLHQDPCPINAIQEMQFCAAQGRDHRPCCMRNGITTTLAGDKCLIFCDQRPGQVTQLDITFLPCFNRFEEMKACFWHDITRYLR
ncbi:DB module [Dirofilaria immitis]|nr:DB module [Dirofilaria immitis]